MPPLQLIGLHMEVTMHQALAQTLANLVPPTSLQPLYSFSDLHFYKTAQPRPLLIKISKVSRVPGSPELARETGFKDSLVHKHLMQLDRHHFMKVFDDLYLVLVQEYAGRLLHQDMKRRKEQGKQYTNTELRTVVTQVASALQHMKERNLVHRSVSPYSIFIKQTQATLGNFSTMRSLPDEEFSASIVGYRDYSSPEVVRANQNGTSKVTHNAYASDVYSLGLTVLEMYTVSGGGDCFDHVLSREEVDALIETLELPDDLKEVIIGMLKPEENDRMTTSAVISRLSEPVKAVLQMSTSVDSLSLTQSNISEDRINCSQCGDRTGLKLPCGHGICARPCKDNLGRSDRKCQACGLKVRKSYFASALTSKSCLHCQLL